MSNQEKKTYLITGGAGFIGSHLVDALLAQHQRVLVIDDLSTGSMENIRHNLSNPLFHFARASITNEMVLDRLSSQADIIVHLAAAVGVQLIVDRPVHTIETNIMGTEYVLRTALRYGCRVLLASTSEVYGKGYSLPFNEDDDVLLGATNKSRWAYAASKMVDEFLGLAYQQEYGLEVIVVRFFNTVGPRQTGRYGMVLPRFVQQALSDQPLTVFGDGEQSRCFCDVHDVVRAVCLLVEHPDASGRVYNIGSKEEISIRALAEQIREQVGSSSEIIFVPYEKAYSAGFEDMRRRIPSTDRVSQLIGWSPDIPLSKIIERVVMFERGWQ